MRLLGTLLAVVAVFIARNVHALSATGNAVLVALPNADARDTYSTFLDDVASRGFHLSYSYGPQLLSLTNYGERAYDHLLLLNPEIEKLGGALEIENVIEFVNLGGNVLITGDSQILSDTLQQLAIEFSIDFDESNTIIRDPFHSPASTKDSAIFEVTNFDSTSHIFDPAFGSEFNPTKDSIVASGVAHRLTGRNAFASSLAFASDTAFSYSETDVSNPVGVPLVGREISIISVLEVRNNARVAFTGCGKIFSNEYFKKSGYKNRQFSEALSRFILQESGVLRKVKFFHHDVDEDFQKGIYLVKDKVEFELQLELWDSKKGVYKPFTPSDMQLEITMLDPYIRTTFEKKSNDTLHVIEMLPDVHGVFTYGIEYRRPGYSHVEHNEQVQIRPPRHNQYPRFLAHAYPYYLNVWSLFVGFWVISGLVIFYR